MRQRTLTVGSAVVIAVGAAAVGMSAGGPEAPPRPSPRSEAIAGLERLPMTFVENLGQAPDWVEYHLHGGQTSVGFARRGVLLTLPGDGRGRWQLGMRFVGAEPTRPEPRVQTAGTVSYFRGDPDQWTTGLPTYSRVAYEDLWPGIDLVYSGSSGRLKYSFHVAPGADPSDIRLDWRGASGLVLDGAGRLAVETPAGTVVEGAPLTYQERGGSRVAVRSSFEVVGGRSTGFRVGSYDERRELVIDPPTFVYAGYIGGQDGGRATDVTVDGSGAAYVTGETRSTGSTFPDGDGFGGLAGPDNGHNGLFDAFVVKIDPSGTSLVYAGYIGGGSSEQGGGIAVDAAGAAYVSGSTSSNEGSFPVTTGPDLTYNMGEDAFVAKVQPDGSSLAYAGYIGGSGFERGLGIAVDTAGSAHVGGTTSSSHVTFPDGDGFDTVPGPDQTFNGNEDAMVAKVSSSGASLDYAGYVGGNGYDRGHAIALDSTGAAFITGEASSDQTTFPDGDGFGALTGIDPSHNGAYDGYLVEVAPGGALASAGYLGGVESEIGLGMAIDGSDRVYIAGYTDSDQTSFPDGDGFGGLPGPDATYNGARDAFAARISASAGSLEYAGYLGGSALDEGTAVAVDGSGAAYVTGETRSTESAFPDGDGFGGLSGPDPTFNGGDGSSPTDAFVVALASTGGSLASAGYIGGAHNDSAYGIAVDGSGATYVVGGTASDQSSFPDGDGFGQLPGFDTTYNGDAMSEGEAFAVKIAEPPPCRGMTPTIAGADGADVLVGTSGPDVIAALGGDDTVSGLGGKDVICAGAGNDTVKGGAGNDQVLGESGNDKLKGNAGNDKLKGGSGKDNLTGAGGNDRLSGGGGKDRCAGGAGTDRAGCEKEKSTP